MLHREISQNYEVSICLQKLIQHEFAILTYCESL